MSRNPRAPQSKSPPKQKVDSSVLVPIPNPLLLNAFGDPLMLQNYRFDQELFEAFRNGTGEDIDKDDDRLVPLIHASVADAIESFIRSRNAQGRNLIVKSQGDSDHIWDIGAVLKDHRGDDELVLSRGDYRWLVQKAGELAFEAFPVDARTFIDHLKAASEPSSDPPDDKPKE